MTYTAWRSDFFNRRDALQRRLEQSGLSSAEVVNYFNYDNMHTAEPDFCPLYALNTKCHDTPKLNCYLCACPHFICSDEPLFAYTYSVCSINSRHATTFTYDNCVHCDCAHCTLPHSTSVALKHYKDLNATDNLSSS